MNSRLDIEDRAFSNVLVVNGIFNESERAYFLLYGPRTDMKSQPHNHSRHSCTRQTKMMHQFVHSLSSLVQCRTFDGVFLAAVPAVVDMSLHVTQEVVIRPVRNSAQF